MKNSKIVQYYFLGKGSILELNKLVSQKRKSESSFVVYVVDHFFRNTIENLNIPLKNCDLLLYANTTNEPRAEYIDNLVTIIKNKNQLPVAIIGIGGGSTMDIAKGISILLTNEGKAQEYQGWDLVKNKAIFKIGIPTLSGTGAEFTRTAVLTSAVKKLGINSDESVFDQVILDPDLLTTVPKDQFIYTAMDCFVHNVESLRGNQNDAMTIALAEKSFEMLNNIFLGKMDLEKLMVASAMGGLAVANSNVGICHPISYGLSLILGLHHGYSICIAFNQLEEYYPEVKIFREILNKNKIVLPKVINDNISKVDLSKMAEATLKNERPLENAFGQNWRDIFTKEKIIELLKKM